ncbi:hypothetical protein [Candidatus Harpocratesius sp.]
MLRDELTEVMRQFQFDYIYVDSFFLVIWLFIIIKNKKLSALYAGLIIAVLVYFIDAVIWWNSPAGPNFPGRNIREYWIGGNYVEHGWNNLTILKFSADFMMTISYSLFAFTWLWIMFESWFSKNIKEIVLYSTLLFGSWLITPFFSQLFHINDIPVVSLRHMDTQFTTQIIVVIVGYFLMIILYGTKLFHSFDPKVIFYVFALGCFQAFAMEFPLWLSKIRPSGLNLLLYEIIILTNQGAPYLFIIWNKILPLVKLRKDEWKEYFLNWPIIKNMAVRIQSIVDWENFHQRFQLSHNSSLSQKMEQISPFFHLQEIYTKFKESVNIQRMKSIFGEITQMVYDEVSWEKLKEFSCQIIRKLKMEELVEFSHRYGEKIRIQISALKIVYSFFFKISQMDPSEIQENFQKSEVFAHGIITLDSIIA